MSAENLRLICRAVDPGPMDPSSKEALEAQVDRLLREVAELRRRVVALERMVGTTSEHPVDRTVTQGKVSYDWQS